MFYSTNNQKEEPYVMLKKKAKPFEYEDQDEYEGFCIDLLQRIASISNFTYKIKLVDDGNHGSLGSKNLKIAI